MRLFVDENLSPDLVTIGNNLGYDGTCARDRDLLGAPDHRILEFCVADDRVCVTNNADDFTGLVGAVELHPGLIVLPLGVRETQKRSLELAVGFIETQSATAGHAARDFMVNRVVEVDNNGTCVALDLPPVD